MRISAGLALNVDKLFGVVLLEVWVPEGPGLGEI